MKITQPKRPIEATSDEHTTPIADGGRRPQVERLADGVEFDHPGDRDGYPFVDFWVTDPIADDHFPITCMHIDDYYAEDATHAAHAFRKTWLESFNEVLKPISADEWRSLREQWEAASDVDSGPIEDVNDTDGVDA